MKNEAILERTGHENIPRFPNSYKSECLLYNVKIIMCRKYRRFDTVWKRHAVTCTMLPLPWIVVTNAGWLWPPNYGWLNSSEIQVQNPCYTWYWWLTRASARPWSCDMFCCMCEVQALISYIHCVLVSLMPQKIVHLATHAAPERQGYKPHFFLRYIRLDLWFSCPET